jgi:hypothetical protein
MPLAATDELGRRLGDHAQRDIGFAVGEVDEGGAGGDGELDAGMHAANLGQHG